MHLHIFPTGESAEMDPTMCACFNLRRAARKVSELYDGILSEAGLSATQFSMLGSIFNAGGASVNELADAMSLDQTTTTRNIAVLKKRGLVDVVEDKADGRRRLVKLSRSGSAALKKAQPLWQRAQAEMAARVGHDGIDRIAALSTSLAPR